MRHHNFYTDFTEKEFAADEYFQQWVLHPNQANNDFWNEFLLLHPGRHQTVLNACRLVEELAYAAYDITPLGKEEKRALRNNIFDQLKLQPRQVAPARTGMLKPLPLLRTASVAAIFFLAAISVYLLYYKNVNNPANGQSPLLAERTGPNEMKKILLPDSTVVILNANSQLRYDMNISDTRHREVELEGNAYFTIKKDPGLTPFTVKARSMSVTVLGTEFNVNARSASPEVTLASGKIKLTAPGNEHSPVYLLPGDKVRLDTLRQTFTKTTMDTRLYSAWTDGIWNFRHNTLEEITTILSEYYGVTVTFSHEKSRHMRIDAVIKVGSLQKLVPVLAQTIHTKMSVTDNRLIIE